MLEVFKELAIQGDPSQLTTFIDDLSSHLSAGWSRDREREAHINELDASLGGNNYVFQWAGEREIPPATLFLSQRHAQLEVTNIVPQEFGQLSRAQYNIILDDFAERNARPAALRLGLAVKVTADRLPITHWLSQEAADRLKIFSHLANRSMLHPLDSERWRAFLIQAHREHSDLSPEILHRWLTEIEHWPDERAGELAIEFEFASNLLEDYDKRQ